MRFGTDQVPSVYDKIVEEYTRDFNRYIMPQGDTVFGFWMQTLADLEFLDLELQGLTNDYSIDPVKRNVEFKGDEAALRLRIAHLEKVRGETTLYTEFVDSYGDTNAYAFHNLYPYKGKFYPRIVRTLINAFRLNPGALILDPFNGSGTTTHEATLMGIESVGVDVTPMGVLLAELKNELPFLDVKELELNPNDLGEILTQIEKKKWTFSNPVIKKLMLALYFDTKDAFARTSRYKKKGIAGLFQEKFMYVKKNHQTILSLQEKYQLEFKKATILEGDVLELQTFKQFVGKFDAIITSPPYYFSIDYVGKDRIAYDYLGIDMKTVESKYLGRKNTQSRKKSGKLPAKVLLYYEDLKQSIKNMFWALKPGGQLAIIVGDSSVGGKKIPTTMMTKKFCEDAGFKFETLIFNPLLGARNRAIRGESIIICKKQ
ncbi:MAG: DNA methyltransferase [Candidatus Heimdallarchaeota archaeon]